MTEKRTMNTVMTVWAYGLYTLIPAFRIEKPPVPAVANAVVSASKTGISNTSSTNIKTVRPM